jgi:hypothetical protein
MTPKAGRQRRLSGECPGRKGQGRHYSFGTHPHGWKLGGLESNLNL